MILRTVRDLENAGYTVGDVIHIDEKSFEELMQLLEKLR